MGRITGGLDRAELVGLDHRLKTEDSFKRKLAEVIGEDPDLSIAEHLTDMKDAIRYTVRSSEESYTSNVNHAVDELLANGYEPVKFKNSWGSETEDGNPAYQGINSFWRDPVSGHVFEVQFHTPSSFDAKMNTHPLYAEEREVGTSPERVRELQRQQAAIFGAVPRPPGSTDLALPHHEPPPRTADPHAGDGQVQPADHEGPPHGPAPEWGPHRTPGPDDVAHAINDLKQHSTEPTDGNTGAVHQKGSQVLQRWNALDPAMREAIIAHETRAGHHSELAHLDGMPPDVRTTLVDHNLVEHFAERHPAQAEAIRDWAKQMDDHFRDPEHNPRPDIRGDDFNGKLPDTARSDSKLRRLAAVFTSTQETRSVDRIWQERYQPPEGSPPRRMWTYDPLAFGGDGRVVMAIGDLSGADQVAVYTPGITSNIRSFDGIVNAAENLHMRAGLKGTDTRRATFAWLGYDAPSGRGIFGQTIHPTFAEAGGHRLAHDVAALHASFGTHPPEIKLFGHSYGSTTTAYAGAGGRLGGYVHSITLMGSPGAGPVAHASEFHVDDRVYVASSSGDMVTKVGSSQLAGHPLLGRFGFGREPGAAQIFGRFGLGRDPASPDFGGVRIRAEYAAHELTKGLGSHTNMFASEAIGPDGKPVLLRDDPHVRVTESLDNLSHIFAGDIDKLTLELGRHDPDHRFVGDPARARPAEPATGYPGPRECVRQGIEGFVERHPDSPIRQIGDELHDGRGVRQDDLEHALGTRLREGDAAAIEAAVRDGKSVFVVDTYHPAALHGGHPGSHLYVVEPNPHAPHGSGSLYVYDGNGRTPTPWLPDTDLVARRQVAVFEPDGTPARPLSPEQGLHTDKAVIGDRLPSDHDGDPGQLPAGQPAGPGDSTPARPDPIEAVLPVLERHGFSLDDLMAINERAAVVGRDGLAGEFSTEQLRMVYEARMAHPHPSPGEVIRKVVGKPAVETILEQVANPGSEYGGGGRYKADAASGCVSVASDAANLRTPPEMLRGLRLDYGEWSPYEVFTTTDHVYVIEGQLAAGDFYVPNGRVTEHLGIVDPHTMDLDSGAPPHTGTGYTGDGHGLNPEYQLKDGRWKPGAVLIRVDSDGSRHLVARLESKDTWVSAKEPDDHVVDGWPAHKGGEWVFPDSPQHGPHPDPPDGSGAPVHRGWDSDGEPPGTGPPIGEAVDPAAAARVFEGSVFATEAGAAFFDPADTTMRSAAGDVRPVAGEFTIDVHGDARGVLVWDGAGAEHRMGARGFAEVIRNSTGWDGRSPIRLLSCDTGRGSQPFAAELARELGVPVSAPDRPVWTFPDGREPVVTGFERGPNGELTPRIPPDGRWHRFTPEDLPAEGHGPPEFGSVVDDMVRQHPAHERAIRDWAKAADAHLRDPHNTPRPDIKDFLQNHAAREHADAADGQAATARGGADPARHADHAESVSAVESCEGRAQTDHSGERRLDRIRTLIDEFRQNLAEPVDLEQPHPDHTHRSDQLGMPHRGDGHDPLFDGSDLSREERQALRDLWDDLTADERGYLYTVEPMFGEHAALPVDVCDHYARQAAHNLHDNLIDDIRMRAKINGADPSMGPDQWKQFATPEDWNRLQCYKDVIDAVAPRHNEPPRYLLGFEHDGRSITAVGNPDTASHTVVFAPGTFTDHDTLNPYPERPGFKNWFGLKERFEKPGYMEVSLRIHDTLVARLGHDHVAVVDYQNYHAPQSLVNPATGARNPRFAREGAAALRNHCDRLQLTNLVAENKLWVAGHSYGTVLVGEAAKGGYGLNADGLINLGSPGLRVADVSGLMLKGEPLVAGQAPVHTMTRTDDPIRAVDLARRLGLDRLGVGHGLMPHRPAFGGQVWDVDTEQHRDPHNAYFDRDSKALQHMARIIAADPSPARHSDSGGDRIEARLDESMHTSSEFEASQSRDAGGFTEDQGAYRATPYERRELEPRFAEPLSDVVDGLAHGDDAGLRQLADDLSGVVHTHKGYAFVVEFHEVRSPVIEGVIHLDGEPVGVIEREFTRDPNGKIVVKNNAMILEDHAKGNGFASAFAPRLEDYYRRAGADRIEVHAALEDGGLVWARQDFRWDPDPARLKSSVGNIVQRMDTVLNQIDSAEARRLLTEMRGRLVDESGQLRPYRELPTPKEIAVLETVDYPDLGERIMLGNSWYGVKQL
ncbi:hypothetical protein BKN37_08830 [Mycobacterium talmoniae]|uniref:DUF1023 domain-containing protein n=2 Tax=Mycobacterium talmoniae TaxID=1858794 RepID=A0A1S1NG46_9MYCO|nr:hypothetical protein BKN37_08830 [Mycobacterium talmoniae]